MSRFPGEPVKLSQNMGNAGIWGFRYQAETDLGSVTAVTVSLTWSEQLDRPYDML